MVLSHIDSMLKALTATTSDGLIKDLAQTGETRKVEFKETFKLNVYSQQADPRLEDSALKTIVAFLNTEGGELLIGIDDSGQIKGVDSEIEKFFKNNTDKYLLYFADKLKARIGQGHSSLVEFDLVKVEKVQVLHVQVQRSEISCFLDNKDYYVRQGPRSDKLEGPDLEKHLRNRNSG